MHKIKPFKKNSVEPETQKPKPDKEHEILREIREMQIDIENLKKSILSETNIRSLESDLCREIEHIKKELRENLEKNKDAIDRMEAEIRFLREDISRIMSLEEEMNRLNIKSITREIEGLKQKSHWLETSIKVFDIDPIVEKLAELEYKINILKASQPVIWE